MAHRKSVRRFHKVGGLYLSAAALRFCPKALSYDKPWQTVYYKEKEAHMNYKIVLHRTDEGISVSVPALPGCWSEGDTEEEALANIQDAIREYLAALEDRFRDAEVREVEVQV